MNRWSALTETVFSLPEVGRLMVKGIFQRDYPFVQSSTLLVSTTFALVNLFTTYRLRRKPCLH